MNFHTRSYSSELALHYAAVRSRLDGLPAEPAAPLLMLPAPAWLEPNIVADIVPDQRGKVVMTIGAAAEEIAARRALMIFARLRGLDPSRNSIRHMQIATAQAFKIDLSVILGRSRRPGAVRPRQIAMILARRVCSSTLNGLARRFDRNHATVLWAERKFAAFLDGAYSQIGGT